MTMPSQQAVLSAFATLAANNCKPPDPWQSPVDRERLASQRVALETWLRVLGDVDDGQLGDAIVAFLALPDGRFWPTPGRIRGLVRRREPKQLADHGGQLTPYARLQPWQREPILREADELSLWDWPPEDLSDWMNKRATQVLAEEAPCPIAS
jgi:hypothetical protein